MKHQKVVVPWADGLHLRRAAGLVKAAQQFRSTLWLKCGDRIADARSILSIVALCATMGTVLEVEAAGDDELAATQAIEQIFSTQTSDDVPGSLR